MFQVTVCTFPSLFVWFSVATWHRSWQTLVGLKAFICLQLGYISIDSLDISWGNGPLSFQTRASTSGEESHGNISLALGSQICYEQKVHLELSVMTGILFFYWIFGVKPWTWRPMTQSHSSTQHTKSEGQHYWCVHIYWVPWLSSVISVI